MIKKGKKTMNLFTRLSASDFDLKKEYSNLNDLLREYLTPYSKDSILNMMIDYQSRDHFYSQGENLYKLIYYNRFLTSHILNFSMPNLFFYYNNPVLLTRANALLIETYVLTTKNSFGSRTITYNDLVELLLLINDEDSKSEIAIKPNLTLDNELLEKLVKSFVKSYNLIECAKLRIPDLNRNYDLIKQLLNTPEGQECDDLFMQSSGIDILRFISIGYVFYCFL